MKTERGDFKTRINENIMRRVGVDTENKPK